MRLGVDSEHGHGHDVSFRVGGVLRVDGQLCWRRLSYKYRVVPIEDYDVIMERTVVRSGNQALVRSFPEIYFGDGDGAGEPVTSDVRNGVGWSRRKYCAQIPIGVKPEQTITIKVTIVYRGLWGLWNVPVRGLDVVSDGVPAADRDAPL